MARELDIKVRITSIPKLPDQHVLRSGLVLGLRRWLHLVQSHARALAPIATGQLRSQIHVGRVVVSGGNIMGRVTRGRAFYGHILEHGVPHAWDVKAKHAWALRFGVGSQLIFAFRARHPGLRARPHFGPALAHWKSALVPQLKAALEEKFKQGGEE